jgi:hypothetical protein
VDTMTQNAATPAKEPRRPFTCLPCYTGRGVNVDLELVEIQYDNRSVEAKLYYVCPDCRHEVKGGL